MNFRLSFFNDKAILHKKRERKFIIPKSSSTRVSERGCVLLKAHPRPLAKEKTQSQISLRGCFRFSLRWQMDKNDKWQMTSWQYWSIWQYQSSTCCGLINYISPHLASEQPATLIHEVMHMIMWLTGISFMERNDEEVYVRCFENLVLPWIEENSHRK